MDGKERKKLQGETVERLDACRQHKTQRADDLREALFFTVPHRARNVFSKTRPTTKPPDDASEQQTPAGQELAEDFVGIVLDAFFPSHMPWLARGKGMFTRQEDWEDVEDDVKTADAQILDAIAAAGFHTNSFQTFFPDLSIGTIGMWVDDNVTPASPPMCMPVPINQLEVNIGPQGRIDDRALVKHVPGRLLEAELRGIDLPDKLAAKARSQPKQTFRIERMTWRKWDVTKDVTYQYVIMVDDELVFSSDLEGVGSNPIVVGRFNGDTVSPFGTGPTIKGLPYFRVLDFMSGATVDRADFAIRPPFTYPDDGVLDFSEGIYPGTGYPALPGSARDIQELQFKSDANLGFYTLEDLERSLKRMHYSDEPHQPGKTPPSSTQWLDEVVRLQKRIGRPGVTLWAEFGVETFDRFRFLLEKAGTVQPITRNNAHVATQPVNPASQSAEMQEVQVNTRFLEAAAAIFPQEFAVAYDGAATMENLRRKMGANLVVPRNLSQDQVSGMVQALMAGMGQGGMGQGGSQGGMG